MQDHGVHRDELLALDTVDKKAGSRGVIELGELFLDQLRRLTAPQ
jgi:hypothetical protein